MDRTLSHHTTARGPEKAEKGFVYDVHLSHPNHGYWTAATRIGGSEFLMLMCITILSLPHQTSIKDQRLTIHPNPVCVGDWLDPEGEEEGREGY
ncbi:hypothetical protein ABKN59_011391 [Abortiporus biennis]